VYLFPDIEEKVSVSECSKENFGCSEILIVSPVKRGPT
jgi:hypothetical protein